MKYKWKSSKNFNEIPIEISIKYQLKSIGNPVEIQLDIQLEIGNWKLNLKFQWNTNGNPVEILIKY